MYRSSRATDEQKRLRTSLDIKCYAAPWGFRGRGMQQHFTTFQHVLRICAIVFIQVCKSANVTLNCSANVTQLDSKSVNVTLSWFANVTQQQCRTMVNNPFIAKAKVEIWKISNGVALHGHYNAHIQCPWKRAEPVFAFLTWRTTRKTQKLLISREKIFRPIFFALVPKLKRASLQ